MARLKSGMRRRVLFHGDCDDRFEIWNGYGAVACRCVGGFVATWRGLEVVAFDLVSAGKPSC